MSIERASRVAEEVFGYASIKRAQIGPITSTLEGKDTFVVLPTSVGKSAIYQIPAVMLPGTMLVFSPLLALMRDQIEKLKAMGVRAEYLSSDKDDTEIADILRRAGKLKLLYCAPERLKSSALLRTLDKLSISRIVIDEAHVLSLAQRNWRPAYAQLGRLCRTKFLEIPKIALTATADPQIEADVLWTLGMKSPARFIVSPVRKNLEFEVVQEYSVHEMVRYIRREGSLSSGSAIVYCATRGKVVQTAKELCGLGIPAEAYHAGLHSEHRTAVQDRFMHGQTKLITATNAFGMGVDKRDVRLVFHLDSPGSIHDYTQEAGRAGRDGLPARCVLNLSKKGMRSRKFFIKTSNPTYEQIDSVWESLISERSIGKGFKLRSPEVEKCVHGNLYERPYLANAVLSYLEYKGAIITSPEKSVYQGSVADASKFAYWFIKYRKNIQRDGKSIAITIRPIDEDFVPAMVGSGAITLRYRNPMQIIKVVRLKEDHDISEEEAQNAITAAWNRFRLLLEFASSTDKSAFLTSVFSKAKDGSL